MFYRIAVSGTPDDRRPFAKVLLRTGEAVYSGAVRERG
jgi:hypothetical protein